MKRADPRILAAAAGTLITIVAAAFAIQAAALGRPSRVQMLVVQAITRIDAYHSSQARLTVNGKHLAASCVQRWAASGHVETVTLSDGAKLVRVGHKLITVGRLALTEFELAACPRSVTDWLTTQLNQGQRIFLKATTLDAKPVYALSVPSASVRLGLYLSRPGYLPVRLTMSGRRTHGTSDVVYGTNAIAASFWAPVHTQDDST